MKKAFPGLWFLIVPLVLCLLAYPFLPDQIPRQFHMDGSVSMMRKEFLFLLSLIPYAIYLFKKKKDQK